MTDATDSLLAILDLKSLEGNRFRGRSTQIGWHHVFGGHVVAQALAAATRTVAGRAVHSLHAYFLLAGDPSVPIDYTVDPIRDGASFSTRNVVAHQHDRAIFSMSASFHREETGFDHQVPMPDVPAPEDLPSEAELRDRYLDGASEAIRGYWRRERAIELRPVDDLRRYGGPRRREPMQTVWIRAKGELPDDPDIHRFVLAYASDLTLLDTSLFVHGRSVLDSDIQAASLDHALWFHRPFRMDEWLLYAEESPSAFGARGFARGNLFTRDGRLVASVAQEGLIRQRRRARRTKATTA